MSNVFFLLIPNDMGIKVLKVILGEEAGQIIIGSLFLKKRSQVVLKTEGKRRHREDWVDGGISQLEASWKKTRDVECGWVPDRRTETLMTFVQLPTCNL